jgi:hypothetical protein
VSSELTVEMRSETDVNTRNSRSLDRLATELAKRVDPLRRFSSTPFSTDLSCMGKCIRLETNNAALFEHTVGLLSVYPPYPRENPQYCWRLISEPLPSGCPYSLTRFAFSDLHLRYAEFGQRNFVAVDLEARLAISFLSDELARDNVCLTYPFLDTLFCMCAASLGFTSLFANCVDVDGKGMLLMGPPGSGKTTVSYLAANAGMHLHADDGVFLELENGVLKAWGGFWPVVFREETLKFLPEVRTLARRFIYDGVVLYHLERSRFQTRAAHSIQPRCCVFLNSEGARNVAVAQVPSHCLRDRLAENLLFDEEESFQPQHDTVLTMLAKLPAYEVSHGGNPALVIPVVHQLSRDLL